MDGASADAGPCVDALYDDAPCGLLVTSPAGVILRANHTFCVWLGRDRADLVDRVRLQDLMTMGGRIFHHTHWSPLMQIQGSVAEVKLDLVHLDGRKLPMVLNAKTRRHGELAVHEVAVFLADDRHKYEQELLLARRAAETLLMQEQEARRAAAVAQAERDRLKQLAEDRALFAEQMVAIVSHDLRNPLSVVSMSAHILAASELSPKQKAALQRLSRSTGRAIRLISDLLDFSRGRLGNGLQVELAPMDVHAVAADALDDLRVASPGRLLEHRRVGDGHCLGNVDRLTQLIGNLVSNAMAYGLADRAVTVTSGTEAEAFWLAVHNEGPPIAQALLPHLFDPMTRGSSAQGQESSVGLGLFIVRQIVDAHGGTVVVTSTAGQGTAFTARFPRVASVPAKVPLQQADAETAEEARLAALARLAVSELREPAFDDITRLAADIFDAPIALITLVDAERQWTKSGIGPYPHDMRRDDSFCAVAIGSAGPVLVVEDATEDARFAALEQVRGRAGIRFYAGAPLVTSTGHAVGTVCVMDDKPRTLDARQVDLLRFLASQAITRLEEQAPVPERYTVAKGSQVPCVIDAGALK